MHSQVFLKKILNGSIRFQNINHLLSPLISPGLYRALYRVGAQLIFINT